MVDTAGKVILVTGATGRQGGAVARHLLKGGWQVRALTRSPDKPEAQALAQAGAEVVAGDLADKDSLQRALRGAYGVFGVTNYWEHGYDEEVREGKTLADAAHEVGVQHFVFSSVGGAERRTSVPHFESKWEIEQHIIALGLPSTVVRPVFFMDNLRGRTYVDDIRQGRLRLGLVPDKPFQMVAVEDIGGFVALMFQHPELYLKEAYELAGDELTMTEVAAVLSDVLRYEVRYEQIPLAELQAKSEERALMYDWYNEWGFEADLLMLRRMYPPLMTLSRWLRATDYGAGLRASAAGR